MNYPEDKIHLRVMLLLNDLMDAVRGETGTATAAIISDAWMYLRTIELSATHNSSPDIYGEVERQILSANFLSVFKKADIEKLKPIIREYKLRMIIE